MTDPNAKPMSDDAPVGEVLILVAPIDSSGRQIALSDISDKLARRVSDIKRGVAAGADAMSAALEAVRTPDGWAVTQAQATFGLTLAAEGSVIVSKASAEASFEISFTYERAVGSRS